MPAAEPFFTPAQWDLLQRAQTAPRKAAADMLLELAAAHWRAGEEAQFAECFRRAFLRKPFDGFDCLVRNAADETARTHEMNAMTRILMRHGILYAPVLAWHAITEARLGHAENTRALVDYDRFFHRGVCAPPEGWSLDTFNEALAREIESDLKFYETPDDRAIRQGWRRNTLRGADAPALGALMRMLESEIKRYIATLPDAPDNRFLAARPERYAVGGWAVVSNKDSHHLPHIHPEAWLTGVYYVTQPPVSREGERGWLQIGPPPEAQLGSNSAWDSRAIPPVRGSFVLMPAYFYHATEPMGVDQSRICVAFEARYPEFVRGENAVYSDDPSA